MVKYRSPASLAYMKIILKVSSPGAASVYLNYQQFLIAILMLVHVLLLTPTIPLLSHPFLNRDLKHLTSLIVNANPMTLFTYLLHALKPPLPMIRSQLKTLKAPTPITCCRLLQFWSSGSRSCYLDCFAVVCFANHCSITTRTSKRYPTSHFRWPLPPT